MAWHGVTMEMPRGVQLPGNPSEIAVFQRQQMRLKSQQQMINTNSQAQTFTVPAIEEYFPKGDLQLEGLMPLDGWPDMLQYPIMGSDQLDHPSSNFGSGSNNSTTVEKCSNGTYVDEMSRNGLRKRKTAESAQPASLMDGSDLKEMKVSGEKRAKCESRDGAVVLLQRGKHEVQLGNGKSKKTSGSADNSKPSSSSPTTSDVVQKPNYIHVRARRGQATDSHSLAERARREKISERMKYLQDLVPGCNKITGKAGMLDEIINYVQSLQRQIEFLSMKLAAANPVFDFGSLELSTLKENVSACSGDLPVTMAGIPSDMMSSSPVSSSSMVQTVNPNGGLGLALNLQDVQLNHTSDPAIALSSYMDVHSFNVAGANSSPTWDATRQNIIPVTNFDTMPAVVPITKPYHGAT